MSCFWQKGNFFFECAESGLWSILIKYQHTVSNNSNNVSHVFSLGIFEIIFTENLLLYSTTY